MKYVVSNTGSPFQFALSKNSVYSFDTEEPTAISEVDYNAIRERIGVLCLKEVSEPVTPASTSVEPAPVDAAPETPPKKSRKSNS